MYGEEGFTYRSRVGGRVTSKVLIVVLDIKAETEEDVVPQEHLHPRKKQRHSSQTHNTSKLTPASHQ